MKAIPIIVFLTIKLIPLPVNANDWSDRAPSDTAKQNLEDAGYHIGAEKKTNPMSKGAAHNSLIFPPRGSETIVYAIADDPESTISITIYNDANGNLIDTITSDDSDLVCRFTPDGGLYRINIKVIDAEAPTSARLISASRSSEVPPTTRVLASFKP